MNALTSDEWLLHPPPFLPCRSLPAPRETPASSSPHSHNEAFQEFANLQLTLMIPQEIVHDSIQVILLENRQFLHMIPFVDATHPSEMHQEFWEELNTLLGKELEAYHQDSLKIS
ncbi:hypothetical protein O181_019783 [Austropuccinia psidii MF-1]|uniref:Uncharacterized protein n=1 Tax=Austropuccinia psidii MF-1 TaxID=1389203 RepID=A0A9Q3GTX6_9BASI|nr:hypothetical protein [Austropuccinia psidii MF-1]